MPLQVRRSTSLVLLLKAQHSFLLRLHCNRAEFFSSVLSVPPTSHSLKRAENCRLPIGLAHRLFGSTVDSDTSLMWAWLTGIPHGLYSQEQLRFGSRRNRKQVVNVSKALSLAHMKLTMKPPQMGVSCNRHWSQAASPLWWV